jgi:hypothetical protein
VVHVIADCLILARQKIEKYIKSFLIELKREIKQVSDKDGQNIDNKRCILLCVKQFPEFLSRSSWLSNSRSMDAQGRPSKRSRISGKVGLESYALDLTFPSRWIRIPFDILRSRHWPIIPPCICLTIAAQFSVLSDDWKSGLLTDFPSLSFSSSV